MNRKHKLLPNVALLSIVLASAVAFGQTPAVDDVDVIKTDTNLVAVNVSVTRTHRPISGLTVDDFQITDGGTNVRPAFFEAGSPASIVLIIDISVSMTGRKWANLREGLKSFLKKQRDSDYTVIVFNEKPQLLAQSISADQVWKLFGAIKPNGETALYDALSLGLDQVGCLSRRHKAVVLLSDGEDNQSKTTLPTVQEDVLNKHTTIYAVGIVIDSSQPDRYRGRDLLEELATTTGGVSFFPTAERLGDTLDQISTEIENQYSIGFYPTSHDRGWRTIDVQTTPGLKGTTLRYPRRYLLN